MSLRLNPFFRSRGRMPAHCPRCGKVRTLTLYKAGERLTLCGWPLSLPAAEYIAVCPHCAEVYRVASPAARLWLSGDLPDSCVPARCLKRLPKGEGLFSRGYRYRKER